jgi:hypothetical protein
VIRANRAGESLADHASTHELVWAGSQTQSNEARMEQMLHCERYALACSSPSRLISLRFSGENLK